MMDCRVRRQVYVFCAADYYAGNDEMNRKGKTDG
jgi:hypothetical protein